MPRTSFVLPVIVGLAAMAACGDPPVGPSRTPPPPPPPPPNAVTSLRIEGPTTIPPEASAQFRLIATFSNGTTADVSAQANWTSDNTSVLSFSPGGAAKTGTRGEVHISARYQSQFGQAHVFVLEEGTFRVTGSVQESGFGLAGARIEVLSGTGAGQSATTGSSGSYAFYGLAGNVMLEATLDGFEKTRQSVVVTEHTNSINLNLQPSTTPSDFRGDWRLTLNASSACTSILPADAATRSYLVTIGQTGTALTVRFNSPAIPESFLQVTGRAVNRTLTLSLPFDDFYYPFYGIKFYAVLEALGPGGFLGISGAARGDRAGDVVTGSFDGEFAVYRNENNGAVWNRDFSCSGGDHTFRMDR